MLPPLGGFAVESGLITRTQDPGGLTTKEPLPNVGAVTKETTAQIRSERRTIRLWVDESTMGTASIRELGVENSNRLN